MRIRSCLDDDERLSLPCSCDDCGHVTNWASTLVNNVFKSTCSGTIPVTCEVCGSTALRAGVTLPAPTTRQ